MASSLGYPFGPPGSEVPSAAPRSLAALTSSAVAAALGAASLPWRLALTWLTWATGLALRLLASLGAPPPAGFIPAARAAQQLRELNSIVDHMHTREDLYRRAIRELQEDLDAKDSDRRKALRKLRTTRDEIGALTDRLAELQAAYGATAAAAGDDGGGGGGAALPGRGLGVHVTVAAATAAVWAFSKSDHAALHWKLVFSMFFPLLWSYVSLLSAAGGGGGVRPPLLLLGGAWFLVGFAMALSLGAGPAAAL